MENNITAVEWLEDKIQSDMTFMEVLGLIRQAKEMEKDRLNKCYHQLTERKHTSDIHFECTICGYNNY